MDPELCWVGLEAPVPVWRLCGALVKKEECEGHPPVGMHCPTLEALSSTLCLTLQPSSHRLPNLFTSVTATYLTLQPRCVVHFIKYLFKSLISQAHETEKWELVMAAQEAMLMAYPH